VINNVNQQYESQVLLRHEITTIIIRDNSNDPYTSSDAGTLLNQFRTEWNNNQGGIQRDVAHLFTGKNTGSTIGIAWLGVVCYTSQAYSLVQSDCCGSLGCTTDLSAHELGHNWNADHQNSPSFNTMYPSIQCANYFIQASIDEISSYANAVWCLTNGASQGACCLNGNQCIETYEATCELGGGVYQGDGTECATADCTEPHGACCVNGSCIDYTEPECASAGGIYAGNGSDCGTTGCSLGACCVGIDCSETLLADCSGSWYGDNTTCADTSCGAGADQLNYELRTWSRSNGSSMETYDVFFPSSDANSKMVAVFGEEADLLQLRSWSNADFDGSASLVALHQSVYGSDGPHDRQLDAPFGNDLVYDSFVTIGSTDSADGEPLFLGFDTTGFNSAAGLEMDNGIWFVVPDDPIASEGAGTTLGHRMLSVSVEAGQGVEMLTNIQWFDGAGVVHETRNVYWNNLGLGGGGNDCPTDVDGNGSTDVGDVLELISQWGPCSGCSGDLNGDGVVNVTDLLDVIGAWGPCSEPETFNVAAGASTFSPSTLDVRRGDTIIWTRTGGNHTVTSGDNCTADGLFDAPLDNNDPVFTWVVPSNAPLYIPYYCEPHCTFGMVGEINVID
jgi:plastocyanin